MSSTILKEMVSLKTSAEILKKLNTYYISHSKARIEKFKMKLKTTKKDKSIAMYVLDIKSTVNSVLAPGYNITDEEYIEVIGLPDEYDAFVTSFSS